MIQTKSFKLAAYQKGEERSQRLALVLPGRLDTKDYPHIKSHVDLLAEHDFLAISFDPPGTWESAGGIRLYSMTNYLKAINELIELYKKPAFLLGHSRGGSMAMLAGVTNPKVIGFAAIMSWYTYKPELRKEKVDVEWKSRGYKISKRDLPTDPEKFVEFKLPFSFCEDQTQYDMSEGLQKVKIPKLFVYGKEDETVKPEEVKKAYQIASEPKKLVVFDSDHDYRKKEKLIEKMNSVIGDFVNEYLE